jgi:flagellar hook-associated protein 1 FlgK
VALMSDMAALVTAYTGLQAAQVGIDTTSHNIANANTEGYTRQRVDLQTRYPFLSPFGPMGSGVEVAGISRARDHFLDDRVRGSYSSASAAQARADLLSRTESAMSEPDQGITQALGDVWAAFEDVAINPSDNAARMDAIARLRTLTDRVQSVRQAWDHLSEDATDQVRMKIVEVNDSLDQVARLNRQIQDATAFSGQPNDLLDRRDVLIDQLSKAIGAQADIQANGTVRLTLGGVGLVDGDRVHHVAYAGSPTHSMSVDGVPTTAGGEISGITTWLTADLPNQVTRLDQFAVEVATALNAQHAAGTTAPATPGGPLLSYNALNPAGSLTVAISNPALLAVSGSPFAPNSGANAQALADVRKSLAGSGGTATLDGSIRGLVTDLGSLTQSQLRTADSQGDLVAAAELARKGAAGVSIDEEMVNLIQYQHAYNAAARVMTAVDQALDTLINRVGVVGR